MSALDRAMSELDGSRAGSCLPEEAPNRAEAHAWLIATRLAQLAPDT